MKEFRVITMAGGLFLAAAATPAQTTLALVVPQTHAAGAVAESAESRYNGGIDDINAHRYEHALASFNYVVTHGGERAKGSLYWKAYVLYKLGRGAEAQAAIDKLRKAYPRSGWLNDAKALELEIKQSKGPVRAESESDEEIKILALNKLMQSDPEHALPQLENLLKSAHSPAVRRQALTVIAMNGSPRARKDLEQVARSGNPDLQVAAIRYLGSLPHDGGTSLLLSGIYAAGNDRGVKQAILAVLGSAKDTAGLSQIARAEKDRDLQGQAFRDLGAAGGQAELWQIYESEPGSQVKQMALNAMGENGDLRRLAVVARSDKDGFVRQAAVRAIAAQKSDEARAALVSLLGTEHEAQVRQLIGGALRNLGYTKVDDAAGAPRPAAAPETLDVVAFDSEGRPVTDLRQTDFVVTDDGKPRPIVSFQANGTQPQTRPAATAVLLDLLNLRTPIEDPSWGQIIGALEGRESGDRLYLYLLSSNGDLYPVHDVPASEAQDEADPHWNRQIRALLDDAARKLAGLRSRDMADLRISIPTTYQAIEEVGARLAVFPGRKNLIWVSGGVPIQLDTTGADRWLDLTPFLWRMSANLDRAHIAVYTVAQAVRGEAVLDTQTLREAAALTGGRFYGADNIDKAISQAIVDSRARYVIGYEPPPWILDNKYHQLRVTCVRKGVFLHSKAGYYGIPRRSLGRAGRGNAVSRRGPRR